MSETLFFWYERTPGGAWSARLSTDRPAKKRGESKAPRMSPVYEVAPEPLDELIKRFLPPEDPDDVEAIPASAPSPVDPAASERKIVLRQELPGEWVVEVHGVKLPELDRLPRPNPDETIPQWLGRTLPRGTKIVVDGNIRASVQAEKVG